MFGWISSRGGVRRKGGPTSGIDRREVLRIGGMAAAGTAGAAVVAVAGATAADAAAGAKMVLGAANDAGSSVTTLSSATAEETLRVSNVANGGAIRVDSAPTATVPVIASTSSSAQPAMQATGVPVGVGGAVAAAGNGPALSVQGVAAFSRSGIATVPAGQRVVTVNVPGGLTASSGAIALQQGSGALVGAAIPDPATGTLAIWTIGPRPFPSNVAWLVFD
jgi:hypothetical protein